MTAVLPEMSIQLAIKRFTEIAEQFTEDRVFWDGGSVRREPGLYPKVRQLLQVSGKGLGAAVPQSRAPASISCLAWLCQADKTVAEFCGGAVGDTPAMLRQLMDADYGPDQTGVLLRWTRQLEVLARSGVQLTDDAPVIVPVRRPCPSCSELWAYRKGDDGQAVRVWALTVSEAGARCGACGGHWTDLGWLARLLDGEPAAV